METKLKELMAQSRAHQTKLIEFVLVEHENNSCSEFRVEIRRHKSEEYFAFYSIYFFGVWYWQKTYQQIKQIIKDEKRFNTKARKSI